MSLLDGESILGSSKLAICVAGLLLSMISSILKLRGSSLGTTLCLTRSSLAFTIERSNLEGGLLKT